MKKEGLTISDIIIVHFVACLKSQHEQRVITLVTFQSYDRLKGNDTQVCSPMLLFLENHSRVQDYTLKE